MSPKSKERVPKQIRQIPALDPLYRNPSPKGFLRVKCTFLLQILFTFWILCKGLFVHFFKQIVDLLTHLDTKVVVELDKVFPNDSHLSKLASCASLTLGNSDGQCRMFLMFPCWTNIMNNYEIAVFFALHFIIYITQVEGWSGRRKVSFPFPVCLCYFGFFCGSRDQAPPSPWK